LKIESLQSYLLVSQKEMRTILYARQADNKWLMSEATAAQDVVSFDALGCRLALAEIYDKVQFER
jgi:Uma2 family endonuclease